MQLPEHVELCPDCGAAPILPESVVLTTPKWCYKLWGECRCNECTYCGNQVATMEVPALGEDAQWEALALEHKTGCEWVETRAHQTNLE